MPKKKYHFFEIGDLIKVKTKLQIYQRDATGKVLTGRTAIAKGDKAIYLGAKRCPATAFEWQMSVQADYREVRPITIKLMYGGSVWYAKLDSGRVYSFLKLVQKVHGENV